MTQRERQLVIRAADNFVRRFSETLDFGTVFTETSVKNFARRFRLNDDFFRGIISRRVIETLDDPSLRMTFVSFMNYYYQKSLFDAGVECPRANNSASSICTPSEVTDAINRSKFSRLLADTSDLATNSDERSDEIVSRNEWNEYLQDLVEIAGLYRKNIPHDVFDVPKFRKRMKELAEYESPAFDARCGMQSYGVKRDVKVFVVDKEIFTIFLIKEDNQLRVLTLGID